MTRFKIALLAVAAVACFSASSAFAWGHISKEASATEGASAQTQVCALMSWGHLS